MLHLNNPSGVHENAYWLLRNPCTLIGSSFDCDIVIKCPGVRPRHALIEFCPKTDSFWLRQLLPFEEERRQQMASREPQPPPPYPYEEERLLDERHGLNPAANEEDNESEAASRKSTREQILQDGTMIELRPLDSLRFGNGPQAVEFTFKMPPIAPIKRHSRGESAKSIRNHRASSIGNSAGMRHQCSLDQSDFSLPIVGSRIQPKKHSDRFARPRHQQPVRLCHLQHGEPSKSQNPNCSFQQLPNGVTMLRRSLSTSRIIAIGNHSVDGIESSGGEEDMQKQHIDSMPLIASSLPRVTSTNESAKNLGQKHREKQQEILLEHVRSLQVELQKREQEIRLLKMQLERSEEEGSGGIGTASSETSQDQPGVSTENSFQEALIRAHEENERLRTELLGNGRDSIRMGKYKGKPILGRLLAPPHAHLNEIVYETFFRVCTQEMENLNRKLSNLPLRDYSDIFAEMNKILHEPFSFRLMEVNSKCSSVFEALDLSAADREQLYIQFDQFLKQKVFPVSKPVDSFLSTLRESAQMARDSAKACIVFSQWSREFGDQLQLQPQWELMLFKVRDLQTRFREQGLPKHWLPPSLVPLLEVLIIEHKNGLDEQHKNEREMTEQLAIANQKIKQLQAELEQRPLAGAPQIALPQAQGKKSVQIDDVVHPSEIISRGNSIPRIEVPSASDASSDEVKQKSNSPRMSPQTPQSARRSRGSLKQLMGVSEDEESAQSQPEVLLDSPHTPPPSQRVVDPKIDSRMLHGQETEEEKREEAEVSWGDQQPEEQKKESYDEKSLHADSLEENELNEGIEGDGQEAMVEEEPMTKARAIRVAIMHLNEVYNELDERRAKSRVASPMADENNTLGLGALKIGGKTIKLRSNSDKDRARSAMSRDSVKSPEGEHWRPASLGMGRSEDENSDDTLVQDESSESDDDNRGQLALIHLNSFYRDLNEKRRKSASTMNDEEESEVGQDELEEATNAKTSIAEANHDTNALSNDEKIIRAEKALLLGTSEAEPLSNASSEPQTVREMAMNQPKVDGHEDEREFEELEREVQSMNKQEEKPLLSEMEMKRKENEERQKIKAAVEFWKLAHTLATLLEVELPSKWTDSAQQHPSISTPQTVGELEIDTRQKDVDSILDRLQSMLNELRDANQIGERKRRRWKKNRRETVGQSSTEPEEAGESAI